MTTRVPAIVCLAVLLGSVFLGRSAHGEFRQGADGNPDDPLEQLTVTIQLGEGADCEDPVALDLGLGFPFWLSPVGRADRDVPFGAVPQETSAGRRIAAGASAAFTFRRSGGEGQDLLRSTSYLLQGVQVRDISRIALVGSASQAWRVTGYKIEVNGKLLAERDKLDLVPAQSAPAGPDPRAALRLRLAELKQLAADLHAINEAGVATDSDRQQAANCEAQIRQLESQLAGPSTAPQPPPQPWFTEPEFQPTGRGETPVKSVKVSVWTRPVDDAVTRNAVYFGLGGHKVLLFSRETPPAIGAGPRALTWDLESVPLTTGDFRGFTLGMLGHGRPQQALPDSWLPDRLQVEVDGQVTYDSDKYELDKKSLSVVRLIPPAHLDESGLPVVNEFRTPRELFVWTPGKDAGLDPQTHEPLPDTVQPLPGPDALVAEQVKVTGFVQHEDAASPGSRRGLSGVTLVWKPAEGKPGNAVTGRDGAFEITLPAGEYLVDLDLPPRWQPLLDQPVTVAPDMPPCGFLAQPAEAAKVAVRGTVVTRPQPGGPATPVPAATVTWQAVTASGALQWVDQVVSDKQGDFALQLAEGDYAVDVAAAGFLNSPTLAVEVTPGLGELEIELTPVPTPQPPPQPQPQPPGPVPPGPVPPGPVPPGPVPPGPVPPGPVPPGPVPPGPVPPGPVPPGPVPPGPVPPGPVPPGPVPPGPVPPGPVPPGPVPPGPVPPGPVPPGPVPPFPPLPPWPNQNNVVINIIVLQVTPNGVVVCPGAQVTIAPFTQVTNAAGVAAFQLPPPGGPYQAVANFPGCLPGQVQGVSAVGAVNVNTIILQPEVPPQPTIPLEVTLLRGEGGPLAGGHVFVYKAGQRQRVRAHQVTDAEGVARFQLTEGPGDYGVVATASGYQPGETKVAVKPGQTNQVTLTLRKSAPQPQVLLEVTVFGLDGKQASPLANAEVLVFPEGRPPQSALQKKTDEQGEARFELPAAGRYVILASRSGYDPAETRLEAGTAAPNVALLSLRKQHEPIALDVQVFRTKGRGAWPLPGADVLAYTYDRSGKQRGRATTDAQGRARLELLDGAGAYVVLASKAGLQTAAKNVLAVAGSDNQVKLYLQEAAVAPWMKRVPVSGVVRAAAAGTRKPVGVAGTWLSWQLVSAAKDRAAGAASQPPVPPCLTRTDEGGTYQLSLPLGIYSVQLTPPDATYQPPAAQKTTIDFGQTKHDFLLAVASEPVPAPAGKPRLVVEVYQTAAAAGRKPLAGASVLVRIKGDDARTLLRAVTDAQGRAALTLAAPGAYQVVASKEGYTPQAKDFTVRETQRDISEILILSATGAPTPAAEAAHGPPALKRVELDLQGLSRQINLPVAPGAVVIARVARSSANPYEVSVGEYDRAAVSLTAERTEAAERPGGRPRLGAATERRVFEFKLSDTASGTARIVIELRRPWERQASIRFTLALQIVQRGDPVDDLNQLIELWGEKLVQIWTNAQSMSVKQHFHPVHTDGGPPCCDPKRVHQECYNLLLPIYREINDKEKWGLSEAELKHAVWAWRGLCAHLPDDHPTQSGCNHSVPRASHTGW